MKDLTITAAIEATGKKIRWQAPADRANSPYTGVAIINFIERNDRRPLHTERIEGDYLDFAFFPFKDDAEKEMPICYSDGDRFVTFQVIE